MAKKFQAEALSVQSSREQFRIEAPAEGGVVSITVKLPPDKNPQVQLTPPPIRCVLEVDGKDIGKTILDAAR